MSLVQAVTACICDLRHEVLGEPRGVLAHCKGVVAEMVEFQLLDEFTRSQSTLGLVKKPLDVFKVGELVNISVSHGDWDRNLAKVIVRSSSLSVVFHVLLVRAIVPPLETLSRNNLRVVRNVAPASTCRTVRHLVREPLCIVNLIVKVEETFIECDAEMRQLLTEGRCHEFGDFILINQAVESGQHHERLNYSVDWRSCDHKLVRRVVEPDDRREGDKEIHFTLKEVGHQG